MLLIQALAILIGLAAPAQVPKKMTYDDDVKPIFQQHCLVCHSAAQMTAGLNLESYQGVLKGGGAGEVVQPGRSASSLLYQVLAQEIDGVPRMPFGQPKISDKEISAVRDWIDQGLLADATSQPKGRTGAPIAFTAAPSMGKDAAQPMPKKLPVVAPADVVRPHPVTALAASPGSDVPQAARTSTR